MTCVGFLIFLGFIVCCLPAGEGGITSPDGGTSVTFLPGSTGNLTWKFDNAISSLVLRTWYFTRRGGSTPVLIAQIVLDEKDPPPVPSSLSGVKIEKPATLLLKNVNESYNGKYEFRMNVRTIGDVTPVDITVFIAKKPTVTLNCSSSITLNEGVDVTCECRGEGGNPPADVTWYKDGVRTGGTKKEINTLTVKNVDETNSGSYTCFAQSYPDPKYEDNETIVLPVYFKPKETSIKFSQNPAKLGNSVAIKCESRGFPQPSFTITLNGTQTVSTEKTYNITEVKWNDTGRYECTATNNLGSDLVSEFLDVAEQGPTAQQPSNPMSNSTTPSGKVTRGSVNECNCTRGTEWYIVMVSLLCGIIFGILLSYIVSCFRRKFRNKNTQSNPEQKTTEVDPTYQELDLTKMNTEDNYQSLRVNAASNDAGNEDDSTYAELSKTRDVENNYQSLT